METSVSMRARELSEFFGIPPEIALEHLTKGFGALHAGVAADFNHSDVHSDEQLLAWYRKTDAYIWELTSYHIDAGFNYKGMCQGIIERLSTKRPMYRRGTGIALGDGIGDFTIEANAAGVHMIYNDLAESRTAAFAAFRMNRHVATYGALQLLNADWRPPTLFPSIVGRVSSIIALDFFEHLTNVEEWARWAYDTLLSGGLFLAQNAFGIGDDDHGGSIPMHLTRNSHFEKDWDPSS